MKNRLTDVSDMLIEQLEVLSGKTDINTETVENLKLECDRAKAMSSIANTVIAIGKTQIEAMRVADEMGLKLNQMPEFIMGNQKVLENKTEKKEQKNVW